MSTSDTYGDYEGEAFHENKFRGRYTDGDPELRAAKCFNCKQPVSLMRWSKHDNKNQSLHAARLCKRVIDSLHPDNCDTCDDQLQCYIDSYNDIMSQNGRNEKASYDPDYYERTEEEEMRRDREARGLPPPITTTATAAAMITKEVEVEVDR